MRAVIQRVKSASVRIDEKVHGCIQSGLLILIGIQKGDDQKIVEWAAEKIVRLRIFSDDRGRFQHDLSHVKGEILVVSQFTLFGDCRKGRRPDFLNAADPSCAFELYQHFLSTLSSYGFLPQSGEFGAHMEVESINDGPVTLILES